MIIIVDVITQKVSSLSPLSISDCGRDSRLMIHNCLAWPDPTAAAVATTTAADKEQHLQILKQLLTAAVIPLIQTL